MLAPADFGIMGIIMLFAGLSYVLVEGGFGQAVAREREAAESYFSSVFYLNLAVAAGLYILFFFTAPLIARFFGQPLLASVIRVLFLALFFNAGYLIQHTRLGMRLDYKRIAGVNVTATAAGGVVGIVLACLGKGVWALVGQQVGYHVVRCVCFWLLGKWHPARSFNMEAIKRLSPFSINLLGTGLLNALFSNLYVGFIGKTYPLIQTGYYTQAHKQNDTIQFTFLSILNGVSYNLFALVHDDKSRMRDLYIQLLHKTTLVALPVFCMLIAVASSVFPVLLGAKWLPSAFYFQLLCMAQLFYVVDLLCYNALNARGHTRLTFRLELCKKVGMLLTIIVCMLWGLRYMLYTYVALCWLFSGVWLYVTKKELTVSWRCIWNNLVPALGMGIIIGYVVWSIGYLWNGTLLGLLVVQVGVGCIAYVALLIKIYPTLLRDIHMLFQTKK